MTKEQCTKGLHRIAIAAVGTLILMLAFACGEAECPEGQTLVTMDGEEFCAPPCDGDDDCADDESCTSGYCVADDDQDDGNGGDGNGGDNGGDDDQCNAQQVCTDYCHYKSGRCIGEECDDVQVEGQSFADVEVDLCVNGVSNPQTGEVLVEGCIHQAELSDAACEQFETEAEQYEEMACDDAEMEQHMCTDLLSYRLLEGGDEFMDACGCEPANTAESCTPENHDECDDYGRGFCPDNGSCTAMCYNYGGSPPSPAMSDPTCGGGDNGMCVYYDMLGGQQQNIGQCEIWCTELDHCPEDSYCIPSLTLMDTETEEPSASVGFCNDFSDIEDFEGQHCGREDDPDCGDDYVCHAGLCTPTCDDDGDCEGDVEFCNEEDGDEPFCDPQLDSPFGE